MVEPRRILLVEDHADSRELLRALCEHLGHSVAEASDGVGAIAEALVFGPDVAFVDIGLPHADGYHVARELRRQMEARCPKLVALSGFGTLEARDRAIHAGFDEYVVKPIDVKRLAVLING